MSYPPLSLDAQVGMKRRAVEAHLRAHGCVLHRHTVAHYWILDPERATLFVHRYAPEAYLLVLPAGIDETVRAEQFDAIEIRIADLLGVET